MQSGIKASQELRNAFQNLLSDDSNRGLLVGLSGPPECLIPIEFIPTSNRIFSEDLSNLNELLKDDSAVYALIRENTEDTTTGPGRCIAITYVPDRAPVRQKMLFAATRLTLVRELGTEHFITTLFATAKDDLTADGWAKHQAHGSLAAPLTEEERNVRDIREAEAQESTGTGARKAHVSSAVRLPFADDVLEALKRLGAGEETLVRLHLDVTGEKIVLESAKSPFSISPATLASFISASQPQYTFYRHAGQTGDARIVLFIYSCPSTSTVKQRMLYASTKASVVALAKGEAGLDIVKGIEISGSDELTEPSIMEDLGISQNKSTALGNKPSFGKPKRPGKR